jgi:hypothetical protein
MIININKRIKQEKNMKEYTIYNNNIKDNKNKKLNIVNFINKKKLMIRYHNKKNNKKLQSSINKKIYHNKL